MPSMVLPGNTTEAEREAMHEVARSLGVKLGDLIMADFRVAHPEVKQIAEHIEQEGGADKFHWKKYGEPRQRGPKRRGAA